MSTALEAWQRGPVEGVPPLLMPVAHALIQAREDAERALAGLSADQIWARPGGAASVGFHVRHLAGALDRLFTYARGESLTDEQRRRIPLEGVPGEPPAGAAGLLEDLNVMIARALDQVRATPASMLLDARGVGRQQLPSNVIGLLFHGAEHATRHAGQAITTARIVRGGGS
jgi:DinB superfamily